MNIERWNKLIDFLEQLSDDSFKFNRVVSEFSFEEDRVCGTVCCAAGWLPKVFPELVKWSVRRCGAENRAEVCLKLRGVDNDSSHTEYSEAVSYIFEIDEHMAMCLFSPGCSEELNERWGLQKELTVCGTYSSPQKVAQMFREFRDLVQSGTIDPHASINPFRK